MYLWYLNEIKLFEFEFDHVNPFPRRPTGHQYRWFVNVWAGIIGSQIVGPIFLPLRLNSGNYLEFIEEHLVDIMDSLPLARRQRT